MCILHEAGVCVPSLTGTLSLQVELRTCEVTWIFVTHLAVRGHLGATILDSLGLLLLYSNSGTEYLKLGLSLHIQIVWSPFLVTFMIQQASCVQEPRCHPGGFLDPLCREGC